MSIQESRVFRLFAGFYGNMKVQAIGRRRYFRLMG